MMDVEQYHLEAIRRIHESTEKAAQPHVDALARIAEMKPSPPMILPTDEHGYITPAGLRDD